MAGTSKQLHVLAPAEAAQWLGIDEGAVRSLVQARYLSVVDGQIPMVEVRAFQARNAESGEGATFTPGGSADFQELVDALAGRTNELAAQALELFVRATPQARNWNAAQRESFLAQAHGRLDAVLAVTGHGAEMDAALQEDLFEVGASAAWAGSSLPHLLLVLRISRDLLLQHSMRLAADGNGRWDSILISFTSELLPAIDRLTDAIANGYWRARLDQTLENHDRLAFLVDNSPFGVYEADIDGLIQYANPALSALVGRPGESLIDRPLNEVFRSVSGSVAQLLAEPVDGVGCVDLMVDADHRELDLVIDTMVRRIDSDAIGFGGIVRARLDATDVDLSSLVRHIYELRRSAEILTEAGSFLTEHSGSMSAEQMNLAGLSVARQAERMTTVIDELDDERKSLQHRSV